MRHRPQRASGERKKGRPFSRKVAGEFRRQAPRRRAWRPRSAFRGWYAGAAIAAALSMATRGAPAMIETTRLPIAGSPSRCAAVAEDRGPDALPGDVERIVDRGEGGRIV